MMIPGFERFQDVWRQPYAPILPWVGFVLSLCVVSYGIHSFVLERPSRRRSGSNRNG